MRKVQDEYLTIAGVARVCPGGPSTRTVWRWILRGVRGVKLGSRIVGGRRYVPREAFERFLLSLSTGGTNTTSPQSCPNVRRSLDAVAHAEAELDRDGVL